MTAKANFSVIQGDTFRKSPTFRRKATKAPIDLTGATITGTVTTPDEVVPLVCAITNPTAGQFTFELAPATTATLPAKVLTFEVVVVYADTTVQTLIQGNLVVTA